MFAGQPIPKSPFEVNVDKALGDASKVTVKGLGIEPVGNIANKPTYFDIYTAGQRRRHKQPLRDVIIGQICLQSNEKVSSLSDRM